MDKLIKIALAVLFLLCLLDMSYAYFQFVRFAGLLGFAFLAYQANQNNKKELAILFVGLAILFQPFLKISLGRTIWNVVDVVVAIGLIISLLGNKNE